ncbi:MAG: hydrogenase 4 subunit F [Candidatus Omnitrophica bacterium]|nr:hydrogenase 4 subunit F [Candidatus Omnitrophota bacterium]
MEIIIILSIPLILALLSYFIKQYKALAALNLCGHFAVLLCAAGLVMKLLTPGASIFVWRLFYVDALSGIFIIVSAVLNFSAALYSVNYIEKDLQEKEMSPRKSRVYFVLFNLFVFTMFAVTAVNNLGFLWVAIEMTTLVSAFLVGFYNNKKSVEAAWKYIIVCSVGIALALFGTILFYYAAYSAAGIKTLNWKDIVERAASLDPRIVKVAFLFILVGYGTKAGLVPMHTWLPDAHSQALTPVSALLSGVLLKTAVYGILRFLVIVNKCVGSQYTGNLMLLFGILSLGVAAGFILVQKDLKRLLAYSSIEHIGIISIGIGFGGAMGLYGALLHVFNHAFTKAIMFFGAGNIVKKYKTNNMHMIHGVIKTMPFTGIIVLLGMFALAGSVPFSLFLSEMIILVSGFLKGYYLASALFLFFVAVIFAALLNHFSRILFGRKPEGMEVSGERLCGKISFIMLFVLILAMGFYVPPVLNRLIISAESVINGA